jgi:hypothetical protein
MPDILNLKLRMINFIKTENDQFYQNRYLENSKKRPFPHEILFH